MEVERRRRDNINEQIHELSALVFDTKCPHSTNTDAASGSNTTKPNKGMVLRKSVEYIQLLKRHIEEHLEREVQMGKCYHREHMLP